MVNRRRSPWTKGELTKKFIEAGIATRFGSVWPGKHLGELTVDSA